MKHLTGNLLDQLKNNSMIVHGCNLQGVWGSGVAKQMKARYPEAFQTYLQDTKDAKLGEISYHLYDNNSIIASAYLQEYYGHDNRKYVSYDAIHEAFDSIFSVASIRILSVHIPDMIGAGLGGGDYNVVKSIIESKEQEFDIECFCWKYEP